MCKILIEFNELGMGYLLRVISCGLPVAGCQLRVASCGLPVAGY